MSYHIFANQFWNELPFKSCYCSETNVNLEGNYLIFPPNLIQNVIIFSRSSSGTSYRTSPVTVPKLMLILKVIWYLLLISHKNVFFKFSRPSSGISYRTIPVTVTKRMLIWKVIIWFLLLILLKMSSYFREAIVEPDLEPVQEPVLEPVTVQVPLLFRNLC